MRRALVLPVLVALAGCGSGDFDKLPRAAEPAKSPPLIAEPAGEVYDVGNEPEGVVADAQTGLVAVALRDPDDLVLFDADARKVLKRVALPESARHLGIAGPGGPVLVPAERANALSLVDLPNGRVRTTKVGPYPHDATAAQGKVFVGDERARTATVVVDGHNTGTIGVASQPGGLATLDRDRMIGVISVRERVLEIFDARSQERVGRIDAGVGPTHLVTDGRNRIYVTDTAGDGLLVYRVKPKLELLRRLRVAGSPYGIAIDITAQRLWVTTTATNEIVALDIRGGQPKTLGRLPAVRQPDTASIDETRGKLYVTGRLDGVLQVLDARATRIP